MYKINNAAAKIWFHLCNFQSMNEPMKSEPQTAYIPKSGELVFERISSHTSLSDFHAVHSHPEGLAAPGSFNTSFSANRFALQRMILENETLPHMGHWMLYLPNHQECVGRASLKPLDRTNRIELQIIISFPFMRKGIGYEAATQVLKGFLPRPVYMAIPHRHIAAETFAFKLGFTPVGPAFYYERECYLWVLDQSAP